MNIFGPKYFVFCLLMAVLIVSGYSPSTIASAKGPLHVKNRFPMHIGLLTPFPEGPDLLPSGRLGGALAVDYSSINFDAQAEHWKILMDMETAVVECRLAYGISERLMVDSRIPFIHMGGGFLDGFLESYHSTFGFPNYGRENRPEDRFGYILRQDGNDLVDPVSESFRPGDIDFGVKIVLNTSAANKIRSSLRLMVQAPTGDSRHWTGNSGWDWGLALPTGIAASKLFFYFTPSLYFNADAGDGDTRLETKPVWGLMTAVEYGYSKAWSWVVQLNVYSPPFVKTGIKDLDQDSVELALGFKFQGPFGLLYEGAFCEDLSRSAPDFTVHLAIGW